MKLKDLVKIAAPIAIGAFAGPMAGTALTKLGLGSLASSPFASSALASGLGSVLMGGKPKDALRSALLGGIGGATFGQMGQQVNTASQVASGASSRPGFTEFMMDKAKDTGIAAVQPKTFSAELLREIPALGGTETDPSLLFRLLNTRVGEGIAAGLVAQLLAGDEEKEDLRGSFERRPYGYGGPGGQIGGINYLADGGEPNYFPRRNGGIDPSEGSGKKDDVPAMLMAGEFVMTRDAVKGAGNGNLRKGIDRMYDMMDDFERMA